MASRTPSRGLVERRATTALAGREIRRVLSLWTQTLLPPVVTGLIFLAIFGGALGTAWTVSRAWRTCASSCPGCWS